MVLISPFAQAHSPSFQTAQKNIRNFRQISPAIFAGGNPFTNTKGNDGLEAIVGLHVSQVISLQGGDVDETWIGILAGYLQKGEHAPMIDFERSYFNERRIDFHNFPLNSHAPKNESEDSQIRQALEIMARATPLSPVFIHCHRGADRTGLLIALFRVVYEGWSPKEAYKEWVQSGHTLKARLITGHLDVYFKNFIMGYKKQEAVSTTSVDEIESFNCNEALQPD